MTPTTEILTLPTVHLQLRRAGRDGPALLFLHGWADSSVVWCRALAHWGESHQAVALDLPGHGSSDPIPAQLGVTGMAELIAEAIERLQLGPTTVVGHSFGGLISLRLALDHPDLVSRLVLVNPAWAGELPWPIPLLYPRPIGLPLLVAVRAPRAHGTRLLAPFMRLMGARRRDQVARWRAFHEAEPWWLYRTMRMIASTSLREEVERLRQPALVLAGLQDRLILPRYSRVLAHLLPDSRYVELPKAGHHPMEDRFAPFRAALDAFFAQT